jgi:hypothetical protein
LAPVSKRRRVDSKNAIFFAAVRPVDDAKRGGVGAKTGSAAR